MGNLEHVWQWIQQFTRVWGGNQLISDLILLIIGGIAFPLIQRLWKWGFHHFVRLWIRIRGKETDHTFAQKYLEYLIDTHRYLDLIPALMVARKWGERPKFFDLEKVYVRLSVTPIQNNGFQPTIAKKSWQKQPTFFLRIMRQFLTLWHALFTHPSDSSSPNDEASNLGLMIDQSARTLICGDPGSGKTTLLKYLALSCARTRRKNKADHDSPRLVKERLLWDIHPFPIFVTLRRHGKIENWETSKGFIDTFYDELSPELRGLYPEGFFERQLHKGNCLILLDGFDELGTPQARSVAAQRIASFLQVYDHPTQRVVVTSRIVGYEGQLSRYGFRTHTVQSLHAGEIRALVKLRYSAISLTEIAGRSPQEMRAIEMRLKRRSEQLIEKIEATPRIAQLAVNPMLLSLIVLIHAVKIELPDERTLLYRDCVEILTERWQRVRLEAAGVQKTSVEELTLSQKLLVLRRIAFTMQQKRQDEGSQALIPRITVRNLVAAMLPDFLGRRLPDHSPEREELCLLKAEEWMHGIIAESGILVELGLDEDDEPLIGFSHLTFQEYLAAEAIYENATYQSVFQDYLLHPAWREVVLLYVALVGDPTPILTRLITSTEQPAGTLLSASCFAEPLKTLQPDVEQQMLTKLKSGFLHATDQTIGQFEKTIINLHSDEMIAFAHQQLTHSASPRLLAAIRILGGARESAPAMKAAKAELLRLVETSGDIPTVVAARESLTLIGDPRFEDLEPQMVTIPEQPWGCSRSPRNWIELRKSPIWAHSASFEERMELIIRMFKYMCFKQIFAPFQKRPSVKPFELGKYLVTNIEYSRFIEATVHQAPKHWVEGQYPLKEATYPINGISPSDARSYCDWLSQQTGKRYRLPTEWEWEWAAAGPEEYPYPWGNQFDKEKCNTEESSIQDITPVGSYRAGLSWTKASDMCGNVWEICEVFPYNFMPFLTKRTLIIISKSKKIFLFFYSLFLLYSLYSLFFSSTPPSFLFFYSLFFSLFLYSLFLEEGKFNIVLCGGAWNTSAAQATTFYREEYKSDFIQFCGFRCARDI